MADIADNLAMYNNCRPHAAYFIDNSHPICIHVNGVHAAFLYLSGKVDGKLMISMCAPRLHCYKMSTIKLVFDHLMSHLDREIYFETTNPVILKLCRRLGIDDRLSIS